MIQARHTFAGYDAGLFTLPDTVTNLRTASEGLAAASPPEPTRPHAQLEEFVNATVAASQAGDLTVDVTSLHKAREAHQAWQDTATVLQRSHRIVQDSLAYLGGAAEETITDHLAPAMADVAEQTRKAARLLPPGTTPRELMLASVKHRQAWSQLETLGIRYAGIRAAQHECTRLDGDPQHDDGEFAAFANLLDIWPSWRHRNNIPAAAIPPWPEDPTQFMLWLGHSPAQPVVRTATQRDRRWLSAHQANADRVKAGQQAANAFGALVSAGAPAHTGG